MLDRESLLGPIHHGNPFPCPSNSTTRQHHTNNPLERFPRQRTIRAAPVGKRCAPLGLPSFVQSSGNRSKALGKACSGGPRSYSTWGTRLPCARRHAVCRILSDRHHNAHPGTKSEPGHPRQTWRITPQSSSAGCPAPSRGEEPNLCTKRVCSGLAVSAVESVPHPHRGRGTRPQSPHMREIKEPCEKCGLGVTEEPSNYPVLMQCSSWCLELP
jgi:hypothetical protein